MNVGSVHNVVHMSWDSSCVCIGCHISQHVNWSICISAHVEALNRVTVFFNQSWYTTRHRCKKQVSRKWHHLLLPNSNKFSDARPAGLAMFLVLWYKNNTSVSCKRASLPQNITWYHPFIFSPILYFWAFLKGYSDSKLTGSGGTAPCKCFWVHKYIEVVDTVAKRISQYECK
jgi:hypothetical protein